MTPGCYPHRCHAETRLQSGRSILPRKPERTRPAGPDSSSRQDGTRNDTLYDDGAAEVIRIGSKWLQLASFIMAWWDRHSCLSRFGQIGISVPPFFEEHSLEPLGASKRMRSPSLVCPVRGMRAWPSRCIGTEAEYPSAPSPEGAKERVRCFLSPRWGSRE